MKRRNETESHPIVLVIIGVLIGITAVLGFQLYFQSVTSSVVLSTNNAMLNTTHIDVIPKGVPTIYGSELQVSYDDISPLDQQKTDSTIYKLATLDQKINLTGNDKARYISIASKISCEYCCGAPSIITNAGEPACGCAHSYAMRGLAKYLITKHGNEYTDDQILEEMGKWKTLFFPDQISQKASILQSKGIELNYINLASNKYRGIEKGVSGGMVGGC